MRDCRALHLRLFRCSATTRESLLHYGIYTNCMQISARSFGVVSFVSVGHYFVKAERIWCDATRTVGYVQISGFLSELFTLSLSLRGVKSHRAPPAMPDDEGDRTSAPTTTTMRRRFSSTRLGKAVPSRATSVECSPPLVRAQTCVQLQLATGRTCVCVCFQLLL